MARNEKGHFVAGTSGNPKGRPKKGLAISEIVGKIAAEKDGNRTRLESLLRSLWDIAASPTQDAKDRIACAKVLLPYIEPEPKASTVIEAEVGDGDNELVGIRFVPARKSKKQAGPSGKTG